MEISEETEDKMLLGLIMHTDLAGENIKRIIKNVKDSASLDEAEALVQLGIFFSRTIEPAHARKLGYWVDSDLKKFQKYIRDEDFRCKDDMSYLCSINCIWFRWCFICDSPLCKLKDDWIDTDSDFCHREEYEVIFEK